MVIRRNIGSPIRASIIARRQAGCCTNRLASGCPLP